MSKQCSGQGTAKFTLPVDDGSMHLDRESFRSQSVSKYLLAIFLQNRLATQGNERHKMSWFSVQIEEGAIRTNQHAVCGTG
jgi:hypothetical protein